VGTQWSKTTKRGLLDPFCRSNRLQFVNLSRIFRQSLEEEFSEVRDKIPKAPQHYAP